jgi:hypothetical protein
MGAGPTSSHRPGRREHPWERTRRLAFARWESEVRRRPYGHVLPDVVGFAHSIEPPSPWLERPELRRLFALSALPTATGPVYLASVPPRHRRPADGALFRLSGPVKRVLPGSDPTYGELLIEARNGIGPVSWEETLEGIPTGTIGTIVPQLSDLWHLAPPIVEALLLPVVGSSPWRGRPAGIDLFLEAEGWSLRRHRSFLSGWVNLAPEWVSNPRRRASTLRPELELVSGARIRRPSTTAVRPFWVQLRAISEPPPAPPRPGAPPRSLITYGSALDSEFEALLSAGTTPLLLTADEVHWVPRFEIEFPDTLRTAVWALHWWMPEPPDTPEWYGWLRAETPRLRQALEALPVPASGLSASERSTLTDRREFRDRLAQTAFSRARLRGASEVEEEDLARTVDSFVKALQRASEWASEGRGPLTRTLDRSEGGRTTRLRRALGDLLQVRTEGMRADEALATLRSRGVAASERDVETQLERLRIRGLLYQDRSGRYKLA